MIKKLSLMVALLMPSLAYGGNPSADLSVQIVPSQSAGNCGTLTGDAANDVQAAGFTTCTLYNDFTTAIPNAVGTGLPSNWLDCNNNAASPNDTGSLWYYNVNFYNYNGSNPCSAVSQQTDPKYGGLALKIHSDGSTNTASGNSGNVDNVMLSNMNWNASNALAGNVAFDGMYEEITFYVPQTPMVPDHAVLWWADARGPGGAQCPFKQGNYVLEDDWLQPGIPGGGPTSTSYAWVNWNCVNGGPCNGCWSSPPSTNVDWGTLHTYGHLITNNGSGFAVCNYIDGARIGCSGAAYQDQSGAESKERRQFYLGAFTGVPPDPESGVIDMWVHSVKFISCRNWQNLTSSCAGNAFNGSFYTGAGG